MAERRSCDPLAAVLLMQPRHRLPLQCKGKIHFHSAIHQNFQVLNSRLTVLSVFFFFFWLNSEADFSRGGSGVSHQRLFHVQFKLQCHKLEGFLMCFHVYTYMRRSMTSFKYLITSFTNTYCYTLICLLASDYSGSGSSTKSILISCFPLLRLLLFSAKTFQVR